MSGPIGSAYPGNFVVCLMGALCMTISVSSARAAMRDRADRTTQGKWETDLGLAVVALLFAGFWIYAIWTNRATGWN